MAAVVVAEADVAVDAESPGKYVCLQDLARYLLADPAHLVLHDRVLRHHLVAAENVEVAVEAAVVAGK